MKQMEFLCLHKEKLAKVEPSMTNFDHTIDDGMAEAIADGKHMGDYAGWDFHAYVYVPNEGTYVADVHVYRAHMDFVEAPTLEELMENVSNRFGWE